MTFTSRPSTTAPDDNPGDIDILSGPYIYLDGAHRRLLRYIRRNPAPDADSPLRHAVLSNIGICIGRQHAIRVILLAQRTQEEEVDTAHGVVEDLNDKILADVGTISALQHALDYISRRQEEY
ncbi:hypothetical protein BJ138DRAFT_1113802 [Hygrophoropsis aurantiaca]|uniref:Uncharacterized protein n=1 Tax=Hygrophoropsis aurantiaca TaxID=72124 RepID=A0ACB8AB81_9AGAM|nr:hypothetical protein BJ138DRAFT_1113802 [Hygrophoropsis aurantiaca]